MIVCGIDFSDNSRQAASAAAAVAGRLGEPLKLVHVVSSVPLLATAPAPEAPPASAVGAVQEEAAKLRERFHIEVEGLAVHGTPEEALLEIAQQSAAHFIVVSSLGTKRQHRWLVGSVAERIAQCSTVPVVVVRDASRILDWAGGNRPLRVVVGSTLDSTSRAALAFAMGLRRVGACDISIVQIVSPVSEHARLGVGVMATIDQLRPELHDVLMRDLRSWAGPLSGPGGTTFVVTPGWGRIDTHLTLFAAEADADLVVVGTHQRSSGARVWQGSTSRGVMHYAASSVACVPRDASQQEELQIPSFRSVLVPTDFSSLGNRAVPFAYGLLSSGGVIHLLHVTGESAADRTELQTRLQSLVPPGASARGISTSVHIASGREAAEGIRHMAGRLGVDVICMATRGRSGASSVILGSQAQDVVRRARQPVLLVPPERVD